MEYHDTQWHAIYLCVLNLTLSKGRRCDTPLAQWIFMTAPVPFATRHATDTFDTHPRSVVRLGTNVCAETQKHESDLRFLGHDVESQLELHRTPTRLQVSGLDTNSESDLKLLLVTLIGDIASPLGDVPFLDLWFGIPFVSIAMWNPGIYSRYHNTTAPISLSFLVIFFHYDIGRQPVDSTGTHRAPNELD